MNDDRISKHIEFKDSLKAYKEYLSKLNMEAKKKLDNLNNKDLDLMKKILGILDKRDLKKKIKKREEKLEIIGEIINLDSKAHLSGDVIYSQNEAVIAALNALPVLDEMAEKKISASFVNEESKIFDAEKTSIEEARKRERELLTSITPSSGFVKVGDNEYKKLADLFGESLGDLSVFDLKINASHQNVDAKLAESLIAKEISLLNDYKKYDIRRLVSYVPQEHLLFARSVKDNILIGKIDNSNIDLNYAIKMADFEKDLAFLEDGLDTIVGEYGVTLSGGQKQRLSIARALMKDAPILILDDSLSAVDGTTEANIIKNLKQIRKNKTNIIVAHRLTAVEDCDEIIVMDGGKIVERGTHEELMNKKGWYFEQYVIQEMGGKAHA